MSNVPSPLKTPLILYKNFLQERDISEARANELGLQLVGRGELSKLLGFRVSYDGLVIPYPHCDGHYVRARVLGAPKEYPKYLSPRGSTGIAYLPNELDWAEIRADTGRPILITEGELKAAEAARKMGNHVAPLGMSGVTMHSTLFTAGIEWKGRTVHVCFDHDGDMSGYKPQVELALGQTCSELLQRGAVVSVVNLRLTTLAKEGTKLGLDDYLLAGGGWAELWNCRSEPAEWCEHMAELMRDCVYVVGTANTHIYNLRYGVQKSVKDFHDAHIDKIRYVDDKPVSISRKWVMLPSTRRPTAEGYTLDPRNSFGLVGAKINLWKPYPTWDSVDGGVGNDWESFMKGLFGCVDCGGVPAWKWVALWTGHLLNKPEERTNQAVLLVSSIEGIGKSLFSNIVVKLCGEHGRIRDPADLFADFVDPKEQVLTFLAVNELEMLFSSRGAGGLNNLISDEEVRYNIKNKDPVVVPNLRRWFFTSNNSAPARVSRRQRRMLILRPPVRASEGTRGGWGSWVEGVAANFHTAAGLGAIRTWFDTVWADYLEAGGVWHPCSPVPETEASRDVAENSRTETTVMVEDILDMAESEWGGVICISPELRKLHNKMFGSLRDFVTDSGGQILRKAVRRDGRVHWYSVYDVNGTLEYHTNPKREKVAEIDGDLVLDLALKLGVHMGGFAKF